jgi:predicted Zn-dependent protease
MFISVCCALVLAISAGPVDGLQEAQRLEAEGRDEQALEAVEALVRRHPTRELLRLEAARLRLKLGKGLDTAEVHLEVARSLAPENPRAHFLWGLLAEERGRPVEAVAALERAVLYRSNYDEARFRLAGLYFARQDWLRAEAHYRLIAQAHPDQVPPRLALASALENQQKLDAAEEVLRQLYAEQPTSVVAGRKLAELYDRTGKADSARKVRATFEAPKKKMRELKSSRR